MHEPYFGKEEHDSGVSDPEISFLALPYGPVSEPQGEEPAGRCYFRKSQREGCECRMGRVNTFLFLD